MSRSEPRPGQVDGLNADDPGMLLLRDALAGTDPGGVLSLCSGDLRGAAGSQQILDRRSHSGDDRTITPLTLHTAAGPSGSFGVAVLWPRAHLGKDFALQCIARGLLALRPGGKLFCAVRKQKGADSIADYMAALFGNVRTLKRERGYRLLLSTVPETPDLERAAAELQRRYTVEDAALGSLSLETAPGVFSRKALDVGTRCLIEHASREERAPKRVLDLCAGWGPLGLWAAQRWPDAQVLMVESNYLATELAERNAAANGFSERAFVVGCAGLPASREDGVRWHGTVDLALINPPTHADAGALRDLFAPLPQWLRPDARALVVAARPHAVQSALDRAGARTLVRQYDRFSVVEAWFAA